MVTYTFPVGGRDCHQVPSSVRVPVLPSPPGASRAPAPADRHRPPASLRSRLLFSSLVVAAVTGIGLVVALGFVDDRRVHDEAERRMATVAEATQTHLDVWLGVHERAMRAIAGAATSRGRLGRADVEPRLVDALAASAGFLTMLATDSTGTIVAVAPVRRADGSDALLPRRSAADREYFRRPKAEGVDHLSGVFQGRGFGSDPIVAVASPVHDAGGRFLGVVEGSLSLDALARLARSYTVATGVVIADPQGVVAAASPGLGYAPLDTLHDVVIAPGARYRAGREPGAPPILVLERRDRRGWIVRTESRLDLLRQTQVTWLWSMVGVIALVLLAGTLASVTALRGVTAPLERLTRGLRDRDLGVVDELTGDGALGGAAAEVRELVHVLAEQRARIDATQELLRTTIERREEVITARTADLQALALDLAEARDRAERASRAKSEFLARMSHELRTPLNSVIGFTNQVLKVRGPDLAPREVLMLQRALANGRHLLALINDILDLARVEAGKVEFRVEPVDVAALVVDVVGALEGQPRAPGVALRATVPAGLPAVAADADRLRQVLVNLVGNAIKFTPAGAVTVGVEVGGDGAPRAIVVRDTGIGIPVERQAAVFQAFEQADAFTTRQYGGTGLGLAISRQLCAGMGAALELESAPGRGSTFRIVFGAEERADETAGGDLAREAGTPVAAGATC
jgi:signal transduction histidine kinase